MRVVGSECGHVCGEGVGKREGGGGKDLVLESFSQSIAALLPDEVVPIQIYHTRYDQ